MAKECGNEREIATSRVEDDARLRQALAQALGPLAFEVAGDDDPELLSLLGTLLMEAGASIISNSKGPLDATVVSIVVATAAKRGDFLVDGQGIH